MKTATLWWILGGLAAWSVLRSRAPSAPTRGAAPASPFGLPPQANYDARPKSLWDRYQQYLATTARKVPLGYEAWLALDIGDEENARDIDPSDYQPGSGGGTPM